jgi:hypothetical protein
MAKERVIKKPEDWLTIEEVKKYVAKKYGRHWSTSYIYGLVKSTRLPAFKIGKIFVKDDVDSLVKSFKKDGPPLLVKAK